MKNLIKLKPKNLVAHPRNMRRFYPEADVREMADSILAGAGVMQPLVVVEPREKNDHRYVVVDGNMRLAAARLLGEKCPPLECKVVDSAEAEQLLAMVVANKVRYDVDPVSEALHYKALLKEGLSIRDVSKRTGVYEARIYNVLPLAELDKRIQQLIVDGKLPHDRRAAKALQALPVQKAVKLAERLAQNPNLKIKTVISAAEKLSDAGARKGGGLKRPAAELSGALKATKGRTAASELREAARKACHSCNQYEGALRKTAEPAWAAVVHAADANCDSCPLKDVQNICGSCPAVALLRRLMSDD